MTRELSGNTRIRLDRIIGLKEWRETLALDKHGKPVPVGEVRRWADGKLHEKMKHGWRVIPGKGSEYKPGKRTKRNLSFTGYDKSYAERKKELTTSNPIDIDTTDYKGKTDKEVRNIAKAKYSKLTSVKKDGIEINFKPFGFKETRSHSADQNVLYVLGDMDALINKATFMFEEKNTDPKKSNTLNVLNYAVKTKIDGKEYYTRIVIREDRDGNFYYDNDSTEVEKIKAKVGILLPSSRQKGFTIQSPYADRITQWLAGVKLKINNKHDK